MRFSSAHIVAIQKGVQAATGLITAILVSHLLSPTEQGYYYTLGSLLSGYILLDLGLSSLIAQKSAQLSKGLSLDPRRWSASEQKQGRAFLGLIHWTQSSYLKLALLSWVLLPIGYGFLSLDHEASSFEWLSPWALIVLCVSLSLPAQGFLALLEGTGAVRETYTLRILHYLLGSISGWVLISQHQALFALSMPPLWTALIVFVRYLVRYRPGLQKIRTKAKRIEWRTRIWPEQKDIAAIWVSNYAILNLPVLCSFASGSVQDAGKLGLSIVVANVLGAVALAPVTARLPNIIHLIEDRKAQQASSLFYRSMLKSAGLYVLGSSLGVGLLIALESNPFSSRILSHEQLALLLAGFGGFHGFNAYSTYARVRWGGGLGPISLSTTALLVLGLMLSTTEGTKQLIWILSGTSWAALILSVSLNQLRKQRL